MISEQDERFEQDESGFTFESDESSDETLESDESDESLESDESDEVFYSVESDESDESDEKYAAPIYETDESDESDGESYAMNGETSSSVLRARAQQQARARNAVVARNVATANRVEAQRLASVNRGLNSQLGNVKAAGPIKTQTVGRLQGAGVVTAILRNGRKAEMRLVPAPVSVGEVNKLREAFNTNQKRAAIADAANSRAISKLKSAQRAAITRLGAAQAASDKELGKRIVDAHARLDKRISSEISGQKGELAKHRKRTIRMLKQQRSRTLWNSVLVASSLPLVAAYGKPKDPLALENLVIAGSCGTALVLDELIDKFAGNGNTSKTWSAGANAWSYIAPVANIGAVHLALRNRQHERFITGVENFTSVLNTPREVLLTSKLAKNTIEEFGKRTTPPAAVVTLLSGGAADTVLTARVDKDKLVLTVVAGTVGAMSIAWMIDTDPAPTA